MKVFLSTMLLALAFAVSAAAQAGTSSLAGTVADASGRVIPNATVTLINEASSVQRTAVTNDSGEFVFAGLFPGTYTVRAQAPGFRVLDRKGNVLVSSSRLSVGTLQLEVGAVTESVQVTAQGAQVQTDSSEKSELVDLKELQNISIRGRDPISFLNLLPGTQQGQNPDFLGGSYGTTLPTFQGLPTVSTVMMADGINGGDSQNGGIFSGTVNMDSIAEVRVLMNNYNAEFGRGGGTMINLITKSGARDYHGSGWLYKRHEEFNANNFFNKSSVNSQFPDGIPKNINRTQSIGADLGGPVWIPKLLPLSQTRDKLFFFVLFEDTRLKEPANLERWTMPTALERTGDFSQSFNGANLITVKDPLTGAPFPGNMIPQGRANIYGLAEENILPLPNFTPPPGSGTYNYLFQESYVPEPRQSISTRLDYHPTTNDTLSFTWKYWSADITGIHVAAGASLWGLAYMTYQFGNYQGTITWTRILTPHLVNELFGGGLHDVETKPPVGPDCTFNGCGQLNPLKRQYRGAVNNLGQFNATWNPLNFVPKATWAGVPASFSTATVTYDGREPLSGYDHNITAKDDLTWIHGSHTFKFGAFYENSRFGQTATSNFSGTIAFDQNSLDPTTTGYAFANSYLGHFYQYTEDLGRGPDNSRHYMEAFYAQDTWKVRHNLTMDIGMRVYHDPWPLQSDGVASQFTPLRYDPTWGGNPPVIYAPAFNPAGVRSAIDPRSPSVFLPQAYIGLIVPGTGNTCLNLSITNPCHLNGIVVQNDPSYVHGLGFRQYLGPQWDPRIGFAWDPFGDGKTAVRAAFGIFHEAGGCVSCSLDRGPAFVYTRTLLTGTLDPSLFTNSGLNALTAPVNVPSGYVRNNNKIPNIFQYSIGVQRTLAKGFFVSVGYVGNTQHYVYENYNYNVLPFGTQFQPQSLDPTSTANPKAPLPQALLEPIPGYLSLVNSWPAARTRYDSLQTKVQRRFASGLELDWYFTWGKNFGYNAWSQLIPVNNFWGLTNIDQTFISNIAFVYPFPKGSSLVGSNKFTRAALDGWQLSGNFSFGSGFPQNISLTASDAYNYTGGGDVAEQVLLTCNPQLGFGDRGFSRFLNRSCVQAPTRNASGLGTSGNFLGSILNLDEYRGPGFNNLDMTLFKTFTMGKEGKDSLTLRWEVYNVPNHAEAMTVNNTARFSPTGIQQLAPFGTVTATWPERRMQISARFSF